MSLSIFRALGRPRQSCIICRKADCQHCEQSGCRGEARCWTGCYRYTGCAVYKPSGRLGIDTDIIHHMPARDETRRCVCCRPSAPWHHPDGIGHWGWALILESRSHHHHHHSSIHRPPDHSHIHALRHPPRRRRKVTGAITVSKHSGRSSIE